MWEVIQQNEFLFSKELDRATILRDPVVDRG